MFFRQLTNLKPSRNGEVSMKRSRLCSNNLSTYFSNFFALCFLNRKQTEFTPEEYVLKHREHLFHLSNIYPNQTENFELSG